MAMNNLKAALAAATLPGSTEITEQMLVMDLIRQRLELAVDIDALLVLEADLRDVVGRAIASGGAPVDAAVLIDHAWKQLEDNWRELRAISLADDCDCPLCPPPAGAEVIEVELGPAARGLTGHARGKRARRS